MIFRRFIPYFLVALLAAAPAQAKKIPYESGETITIMGTVTDGSGAPIAHLDVVFEAARKGFSLRPFGKAKKEIARKSTQTDDRGTFRIDWPYEARFNHFELLATVEVIEGGKTKLQVLDRLDITRRLRQSSPVTVSFSLEDTSFLDSLRSFLSATSSEDERRIYRERGRPDRVDRLETPDYIESSWWYFSQGRVLQFKDGTLVSEEEFAPVGAP